MLLMLLVRPLSPYILLVKKNPGGEIVDADR
jgi:hypothetical protein